jgi:hypothetical protein
MICLLPTIGSTGSLANPAPIEPRRWGVKVVDPLLQPYNEGEVNVVENEE